MLSIGILAYSDETAAQLLYAYVPNAGDGTVSAIELTTDRVAWTIKIGEKAAHGIAASPDGKIIYAGDDDANELVVIDASRQSVIKRIPVAFAVHGIDISPDGRTVWAGGLVDNDPVKGTLAAFDTAALAIQDMISPSLGAASHFAVTPDSKEVWIASTSTNLVWVVDADTRRVAAAVPLALPESERRPAPGDDWDAYLAERKLIGLNEIAISPDGETAYAVGPAASELFAIDVKTRRVVKSVHAGERAHGVTVRPNGKEVWIADWAGMVNVFDTNSLAPLFSIRVSPPGTQVAQGANHIAFGPDGTRVYVTAANEVVVIDPGSGTVIGRVPVGKEPHEISLEDWIAPASPRKADAMAPQRPSAPSTKTSVDKAAAQDNLTRTRDVRSVIVEVTPDNLWEGGDTLDFHVALNTHAVELDYDFASIASLRDDNGNEYRAAEWDGPRGGHHVAGVLRFSDRQRIFSSAPNHLELRLDGLAGAATSLFRWDLQEIQSGAPDVDSRIPGHSDGVILWQDQARRRGP